MFSLQPKLPVNEEERQWVEDGFRRLKHLLGEKRMRACEVVEPTDEFFPDPFDQSEAALERIFRRVCDYMGVDRSMVELAVIPDTNDLVEMLPTYSHNSDGPAGLHFGHSTDEKPLIGIRQSLLKDPMAVVATAAHELGHVILLDGGHVSRNEEDMEPMTDLVTVYMGLGIFTANASHRYMKFQDDRREGWSVSRLGYLPEEVYGYALALFAKERGEINPKWTAHLATNVSVYFRRSVGWIEKNRSIPA
ncbi:MAG TPA: hypothetical protein VMT38_05630 [Terracidiphilus sp.]|nr:hypothetical protein [Terracidiphilus sp.]